MNSEEIFNDLLLKIIAVVEVENKIILAERTKTKEGIKKAIKESMEGFK